MADNKADVNPTHGGRDNGNPNVTGDKSIVRGDREVEGRQQR